MGLASAIRQRLFGKNQLADKPFANLADVGRFPTLKRFFAKRKAGGQLALA